MDLTGKKIVVTGGAGVLGHAVAKRAEALGASVVVLDVVDASDLGVGESHVVDLTDQALVRASFESVGPIHGIANIAGGFDMGPAVYETEDAMWEQLFAINVTTLRRVLSAGVPQLLANGGGSIVNVGALGALQGGANMGAYGAAKSTVMRLTESLAEEVRHKGINVNAVLPSLIDTPRNRADMPDADHSTWVSPEALADVVCFLLSAAARDVHGALIPVRGLV